MGVWYEGKMMRRGLHTVFVVLLTLFSCVFFAENASYGSVFSLIYSGVYQWMKGGGTNMHHSFPKFMGGNPSQTLTKMAEKVHVNLHKDMMIFLKNN